MNQKEQFKAQTIVNRITSGNFDTFDVENLIMTLREAAKVNSFRSFNEIGHFIAHNGFRIMGITKDRLDLNHYRMQFFADYQTKEIPFNLSHFAPYIKELLILQLEICDSRLLLQANLNKADAKKLIGDINRKTGSDYFHLPNPTQRHIDLINTLLSVIISKPVSDDKEFLKELMGLLQKLKLTFDKNDLLNSAKKISLAVIYLLHDTRFKVGKGEEGKLEISRDWDTELRTYYLNVNGTVPITFSDKTLLVSFPIFTTSLLPEEWCDANMFSNSDANKLEAFVIGPNLFVSPESFKLKNA